MKSQEISSYQVDFACIYDLPAIGAPIAEGAASQPPTANQGRRRLYLPPAPLAARSVSHT